MRWRAAHNRKPVEYDALSRRLWIFGQRCHHGATGTLMAAVGCLRLLAEPGEPGAWGQSVIALAAGGVLMVHDWKDRSIWFEPGHGSQP